MVDWGSEETANKVFVYTLLICMTALIITMMVKLALTGSIWP